MVRQPGNRRQVLAGNLRLLRRSPMLLLIGGVLLLCAVSTCTLTWLALARSAVDQGSVIVTELPAPPPNPPPVAPAGLPWVAAQVVRVVDGDTLIVAFNGTQPRLRLIGMDTPETVHPTKPVQCFGAEATARMQQIVNSVNGQVWLEKDVSETDRYGRLLRYVWLGPTPASPLLNEQLVAEGYAQVSTFPPDVKYQDRFLVAQRAARAANRGLWGACGRFGLPVPPPTPGAAAGSQ
jgi:endonuclease YncB( thermonuclease family)